MVERKSPTEARQAKTVGRGHVRNILVISTILALVAIGLIWFYYS